MTEASNDIFTVSALAQLFRLDRRTVTARLADVEPKSIKVVGERTFRFYTLGDVRKLLETPGESQLIAAALDELEGVRADVLELRRMRKRREFLDHDEVERAAGDAVTAARNRFLALQDKLRPQLNAIFRDTKVGSKAREKALHALLERELGQIAENLEAALKFRDTN